MEELLILRLPPRLAARLNARVTRQERTRGEGFSFRRRRKNQKGGKTEKDGAQVVIDAVWGEDGAPDYDSTDDATDLLDLEDEGPQSEEEGENGKKKLDDEDEEDDDLVIDYWRVENKDFIFRYGEDEYYATLVNLPCVIECQKTLDSNAFYKTGDVGQMLIVHDIKVASGQPRPAMDPNDFIDGVYVNGVTPPMHHIAERFEKVTSSARRKDYGLTFEEIHDADEKLNEFKELVIQRNKKFEAQQEKANARKNAKQVNPTIPLTPTLFIHEEIIDAEPWMEFHPNEKIVVEQRNDNFLSSTREEQIRARNHKAELDEKRGKVSMAARGLT